MEIFENDPDRVKELCSALPNCRDCKFPQLALALLGEIELALVIEDIKSNCPGFLGDADESEVVEVLNINPNLLRGFKSFSIGASCPYILIKDLQGQQG